MADEKPVTVLVVDDNPATLYSTTRFLRAAGFAVIEVTTGTDAVARSAQGVDIVILDVNLPDIDGFEVCRQIRAREATRRLPVIHLSATFVADTDKVHGLEAGADGYLTHPVEPPVLVATVRAFLRAREAEEAMRRSEEKFRTIFDLALDGICLLSQDLVFLEVNPAMCKMLGRNREELIGKHNSAFVPKGYEDDVAAISRSLNSGSGWRGTLPLIRADGSQMELEWSVSIYSFPGVRLAIITDITKRKLVEVERERLLAAERSARAEAERASRLKDDFLATLSHELRTPLNAIVGWSQILATDKSRNLESFTEGMDVIARNARAQAQLIDDLLDMSRIISGKVPLKVEKINLSDVIRAAMTSVVTRPRRSK
jgi:PAS domain S-box-containing protein